ncbi:MAG: DUF4007 family protein [Smithellaceae bacterium]
MRFSGHETFHIREGWLHKGLKLLCDEPAKFHDPYMHDWLGVGSNMGKSIQHWLVATKLAERKAENGGGLSLSELGRIILEKDPYFLSLFTWWVLHINLVNGMDLSTSWHWFFNYFLQAQFKKEHCVEQLVRHFSTRGTSLPGIKTLERDMSCLLSSYARTIPEENSDPEESYNCPFRKLGMFIYFKDTNTYHLNRNKKNIPGMALGYCLSLSATPSNVKVREVSISDAAAEVNGPGKCFGLPPGEIFDLVEAFIQSEPKSGISLVALAGKRLIQFPNYKPNEWVHRYFKENAEGVYGRK